MYRTIKQATKKVCHLTRACIISETHKIGFHILDGNITEEKGKQLVLDTYNAGLCTADDCVAWEEVYEHGLKTKLGYCGLVGKP